MQINLHVPISIRSTLPSENSGAVPIGVWFPPAQHSTQLGGRSATDPATAVDSSTIDHGIGDDQNHPAARCGRRGLEEAILVFAFLSHIGGSYAAPPGVRLQLRCASDDAASCLSLPFRSHPAARAHAVRSLCIYMLMIVSR